jgi:hypothetical protein
VFEALAWDNMGFEWPAAGICDEPLFEKQHRQQEYQQDGGLKVALEICHCLTGENVTQVTLGAVKCR